MSDLTDRYTSYKSLQKILLDYTMDVLDEIVVSNKEVAVWYNKVCNYGKLYKDDDGTYQLRKDCCADSILRFKHFVCKDIRIDSLSDVQDKMWITIYL